MFIIHLDRCLISPTDQMYAVKKCLALINVMIDLLVSQVAVAMLYKSKLTIPIWMAVNCF